MLLWLLFVAVNTIKYRVLMFAFHVRLLSLYAHTFDVHAFVVFVVSRMKPSSGKLPSGHQWGDLLDAMVTKIWVEEQTKKGEAKRKRDAKRDSAVEEELFGPSRNPITGEIAVGGTPGPAQEGAKAVDGTPGPAQEGGNTGGDTPAPAEEGDNAVGGTPGAAEEGVTAREHAKQVEDEMEQYFLKENPKPPGWLPPYFLSWVVFGPLSSSPDEDFTMDMSSGPEVGSAKDGAEKKLKGKAGSSSLRSPAQLKMLAPPGTGMSRALSKKLESEENERTWRDDRSTRRSEALDRGQKQIAEVADTLKVLVKECRRDAEADEIERQSKRYAELEELHREDGDHDLADAVRKKRIKLLSGSLDKGAAIAVGAASSQTSGACSTDSRSTARHNAGRSPREDGSGTSACEGRSPSPELLVPPATHEDLTLTSISSGDSGGSVWDRNESPTSTVGATHPRSVGPSSWQESRRYASAQYEHASVPPPTVRSRQPGFGREGIATTTAVQSVHGGLGRSLDGAGEVPTRSYAFLFGGQAGDANQRLAFARGSSGYEVDSGRGQRSERAASGQAPDAGGRAL